MLALIQHPSSIPSMLLVTGLTSLSCLPAAPGQGQSVGKGERERRGERIGLSLSVCEFAAMLAFARRGTFHVAAAWWMKRTGSEK